MTYLINRTWSAVDACGNSNTCNQLITVGQSSSSSVSGAVLLTCIADTYLGNTAGIASLTVTLENSQGGVITSTTTDNNGNYSFGSLAPGNYIVVVTPPNGYTENYPASSGNQIAITLAPCQSQTGVNFAYTGSTLGVQLIKTAPCTVTCSGTIVYNFAVTNTGNTCESLVVVDPLLGGTIFSQVSVAPGQGFVFAFDYVAGSTNGPLTNTAWAIATGPNGQSVTNTSSAVTVVTTESAVQTIACNFNSQNPGGGYLWCNAHISANPGQAMQYHFLPERFYHADLPGWQLTYIYPVPDCQINFSQDCLQRQLAPSNGRLRGRRHCRAQGMTRYFSPAAASRGGPNSPIVMQLPGRERLVAIRRKSVATGNGLRLAITIT